MKHNLYVLVGCMGSGKSSIAEELSKMLNIPIIRTTTSRPIREGESANAYNFVSETYFIDNEDSFIETQSYNTIYGTWHYGLEKKSIDSMDSDAIVILSPCGYKKLLKASVDVDIKLFYIYTNTKNRLSRLNFRGDNEKEITRRMEADKKDFENILDYEPIVIYNNNGY